MIDFSITLDDRELLGHASKSSSLSDADGYFVGDVENGLLTVEGHRARKVLCIYKRNAC